MRSRAETSRRPAASTPQEFLPPAPGRLGEISVLIDALDPVVDLVAILRVVLSHRLDLIPPQAGQLDRLLEHCPAARGNVAEDPRHLPHVGTTDQSRPPTGWTGPKHDLGVP